MPAPVQSLVTLLLGLAAPAVLLPTFGAAVLMSHERDIWRTNYFVNEVRRPLDAATPRGYSAVVLRE